MLQKNGTQNTFDPNLHTCHLSNTVYAYLKLVFEKHLCPLCFAPVLVVSAGPAPTDPIGSLIEHCPDIWHLGDPACPILGWAALIMEDDRVPGRWPRRWPLGIVLYRIYPQLFLCGLILCIHWWKVYVSLSKNGLIDPWDKLSIWKQTTQCIR